MDVTGSYTVGPPTRKLRKTPEINTLTFRPTFVISRSGVRIRPPAPTQVNMGEFQSGQMGQTVNLLAMPSVVRIHLPPPIKETSMRMSLLFGVKTVVDSNRGRLETCRGKSAMPLLEADKGMALFPQPQLLQGYANADLQKLRQGGFVSTRGGLPAGRRIHLIYCLLTPCTHVHVEASKTPLTQTVTQMRIGEKSTGQFLPGAFCVWEGSFYPIPVCADMNPPIFLAASACISLVA